MPGFILHMTAAQMLLEKHKINVDQDAFQVGNLIADSVSDKTYSHFRHPRRQEKLMVYPDLNLFLDKYKLLLSDSSCLGYYYHLFVDRIYAKEYIPQIVSFYGTDGQEASDRQDIKHAHIKRTNELVPIKRFFSDEYYYGDFTKLNTYLMNRFHLCIDLKEDVTNPGIEEVDYKDIEGIKEQLQGYLDVSEEAVNELRVFEPESLIQFLQDTAEEFSSLLSDLDSVGISQHIKGHRIAVALHFYKKIYLRTNSTASTYINGVTFFALPVAA